MWFQYRMSRAEFVATLKHTLDLRLAGNRCPFLFGGHSDFYTSAWDAELGIPAAERRAALQEFIDYALSLPQVRLVPFDHVLDWICNPVALGSA